MAREEQAELERIVRSTVDPLGIEFVEVRMSRAGSRRVLRVDIDRPGPGGVTLEDCQRVSDALGERLDSEGPTRASYVLEVSSPGADRPIRTPDEIRRNTGRLIDVVLCDGQGRESTIRGQLLGADGGRLIVDAGDGQPVRIPLEHVVLARQVLKF